MGIFEQFPYVNFHELNLDWIINELKKQGEEIENLKIEESDITPIIATADYIGLSEVDTGSYNSDKINDFIANGEQKYLYIPNGTIYNFSDPIVFTRDIILLGGGQLRYNGILSTGYFITTYNRAGNYATILPQNNKYYYNIDCAGKINGILFNQGIHNTVYAYVRNANNIGFNDNVSGVGYENNIFVSVVNDNDAIYNNAIGVYCNHPDNHYGTVYTRNCNIGFYANKLVHVDYIHAWIVSETIYINSCCAKINSDFVTIGEIYCDTMQFAIYLEKLANYVKIETINSAFNNNAVSSATYNANKYRPWDCALTPAANENCNIEIGAVNPLSVHGTVENTLQLKEIDKCITIKRPINYRVSGNFRFIPVTDGIYCAGNQLTDLPSQVPADYYAIRSYLAGEYYKVIELINDNTADDNIMIWYNKTNGRSIFFSSTKTYVATVQY